MNNRSVASLSLKLLGIYAIILALPHSQMLLYLTQSVHGRSNSPLMIAGYLAPFLLLIVTGVTLISFSAKLSGLLVSTSDSQPKPEASGTDIQAIAFSIAGVIITSQAIPKITQIVTNISLLNNKGLESMAEQAIAQAWARGLGLVVQLAIGLWLFFGARGLAHMWQRLQETRPMR
jgi:hypothetical protein